MNFLLSDDQREILEAVERYFAKALPAQKLHAIVDGDSGFDASLWQGLAEIGALGALVPEAHGGLGLEMIDAAIVAEAIGRVAAPVPYLGHQLAVLALSLAGSPEQQAQWLPGLADGSRIATVAFLDQGGWQPEQWKLDGGSSLSGAKRHVPFAPQADLVIVGVRGGGLVLVERGATGLAIEPEDGVDRTRRLSTLRFSSTPGEVLPGASAGVASRVRDAALALVAADAFGGATRALDMAVEYAKTRQQFGAVIGQFQALKHQLANMAVDVEPARGLYWYAAHAFDHLPDAAPRACALAKAHLADRYVQVARDATEAHGGIGYTWEYDLHVWLKRAMFDSAWMGTAREHRARAADLAGW